MNGHPADAARPAPPRGAARSAWWRDLEHLVHVDAAGIAALLEAEGVEPAMVDACLQRYREAVVARVASAVDRALAERWWAAS